MDHFDTFWSVCNISLMMKYDELMKKSLISNFPKSYRIPLVFQNKYDCLLARIGHASRNPKIFYKKKRNAGWILHTEKLLLRMAKPTCQGNCIVLIVSRPITFDTRKVYHL